MLCDFPPEKVFRSRNEPLIYEDMYFAACADISEANFRVPSVREALEFSVDFDLSHCYRWMPKWLPFGCHAWDHADYWHWKPIIEAQGYELPPVDDDQAKNYRLDRCKTYLFKRFLRSASISKNKVIEEIFHSVPVKRKLALWGWGFIGSDMAKAISLAGKHVAVIFDKRAHSNDINGEATFMKPNLSYISRNKIFVIISTTIYEDEIANELSAHGLLEGEDYMRGTTFMRGIAKAYLKSFGKAE